MGVVGQARAQPTQRAQQRHMQDRWHVLDRAFEKGATTDPRYLGHRQWIGNAQGHAAPRVPSLACDAWLSLSEELSTANPIS
jgi:hypothetical protein